jgi:hypothetical protein
MAESTIWPRPERPRWWTATRVPRHAYVAASESPSEMPARTGGLSGSPITYRIPPIASPIEPKPARLAYGPVCPYPVTRVTIRPGLVCHSVSGASPQRSSVPGRKFSTTTSAVSISLRTSACPSGRRRSQVTDFLLRATTGHHSDLPCGFSRPHSRMGSPLAGSSTFTTSAPKSPSNWPQNGPASNCPNSTTRRSSSGRPVIGGRPTWWSARCRDAPA